MALALTITRDTYDAAHASDPKVEIDGYIAWDNSYPANGEPLTVAIVNTALAAARHSGCTVSAINNVLVEPPIDRSMLPVWDSANGKVIAYAKGAAASISTGTAASATQPTLTVVTTTPVSVTTNVSDALPAGTVAPIAVKILTDGGGGATGVCNLTPAAPATTLDAQWDPATRKVTFLAADNAATCAVQALVWTAGTFTPNVLQTLTTNTSSYLAEITGATDLSAATYNCRVRIIATKTA